MYRLAESQSLRRVLLPRVRYHAYYEVHESSRLVRIVAFWLMPRYQVQIAPRAQSQIDEVSAWWAVNRPAASVPAQNSCLENYR